MRRVRRGLRGTTNTTPNDDNGMSESTWTDSLQPAIMVQIAAEMSQVQLIDKLVDVFVSTQEQLPAARVVRRKAELLEIQIQFQFTSSFSTESGTHSAKQTEHCGDSTGAALEQGCDSRPSTVWTRFFDMPVVVQ